VGSSFRRPQVPFALMRPIDDFNICAKTNLINSPPLTQSCETVGGGGFVYKTITPSWLNSAVFLLFVLYGITKPSCHLFPGALAKLRKSTISFAMSACPSVRPPARPSVRKDQLGSHWTDFHEILYLNIFRKSIEKKFKFH